LPDLAHQINLNMKKLCQIHRTLVWSNKHIKFIQKLNLQIERFLKLTFTLNNSPDVIYCNEKE